MKFKTTNRFRGIFAMIALSLVVTACSTTQSQTSDYDAEAAISDPLEPYNRAMTTVNEAFDKVLFEPVARGYRYAVPSPARTGVRNFLRNLRSPVNAANQLLQGDVEGFAHDTTRTVINTFVGVGGLIDVAADMGLEYEHEDFGQTLAVWGVDHGAYFVLPLIGPSSLRDATGMALDTYADPVRLYLYNTSQEGWYYARVAATAVDRREELLDAIDDLRRNSFDYYAALRSAYAQKRDAMVRDDKPSSSSSASIPDYDE